jgi:oligopeptide transport system permease protein
MGAIFFALVIGVAAGVIGAVRKGGLWDYATLGVALIGISLPTFVTGSALLIVFSINLQWVRFGWGGLDQMILPMITLSLPFAAYIARLTRLGMIDVLGSDFIRTAKAKGLAPKIVVLKHALKVAFLPVLSYLGPAAAAAMTGSFVVEQVFNIPGMGQHFVDAVQNKDLMLIMGVVLLYATLLIVFNLLVDIAYQFVDPRIQLHS